MKIEHAKVAAPHSKRGRAQLLSSEEEQRLLTCPQQDPAVREAIKRRIRSREWARSSRQKNVLRNEALQERSSRLSAAHAELERQRRLQHQCLQSIDKQVTEIASALSQGQNYHATLARAHRALQRIRAAFTGEQAAPYCAPRAEASTHDRAG